MKKKLLVALVIFLVAGLIGTFISQNTDIPLLIKDPGYRMAVALEREYPFLDVWEIRSDGEFIYVSILWLETPPKETMREVADTVNKFVAEYRTDERRVVFRDIIRDGKDYWVIMLSCAAEGFGKDEPIYCQIWPWPLQIKPEHHPWVGR